MNIIRILNLYKQHCLNDYEYMAKKEYSCWGYFDCMSVEPVQSCREYGLLMTKDNVDMTDLWYASANSSKQLNGRYGQQSIGMFRYEKDEEKEEKVINDRDFWDEKYKSIILIACMIQVEDAKVTESIEEIERLISAQKNIQGIVYRTFDNCDIILFLKGNSYMTMAALINEVGRCNEVKYKYSVCGIAQAYLDKLDKNSNIGEVEYNNSKLVNDEIAEVWLEIVSNEKVNLNKLLLDFQDKTTYAKVFGYMDHIIRIQDTDMWHVVCLLKGKNVGITHENEGFRNGIYNISTVILQKWEKMTHYAEFPEIPSDKAEPGAECIKQIQDLMELREKVEESKNEILYSNWLALIRLMNVLSQYENSVFSKDIFRIIFPSIKLMRSKLEDIVQIYSKTGVITEEEYQDVEKFEEYISEVDGVIQHLFHTSQTFLSVPGYTGSLYDIPTGLLLFYMAYAHKLIKIFNDSEQDFTCFICPLLNHKPEVWEVETRDGKEALLDICFAQRHLYMPRALLVILSHEIYHYVGKEGRCREERADHLVKMCAYAIAYNLLPPEGCIKGAKREENKPVDKFSEFTKRKQEELQEFLVQEIARSSKAEDIIEKEKKYFSKNLKPLIVKTWSAIVSGGQNEFEKLLRQIQPNELQGIEDVKTFLSHWNGILENVEKNRKKIETDTIEEIVDKFIYSFQEIYADISTIVCLELELKYYFEAILVSEGMIMNEDYYSIIVINRLAVVIYALCNSKKMWKEQWEKLVSDDEFVLKELVNYVNIYIKQMESSGREKGQNKADDIKIKNPEEKRRDWIYFNLDGVWHEQVGYAKSCIDSMQAQSAEKENELKDLRAAFAMFVIYDANNDKTFKELFEAYDRLVKDYQ